MKWTWTVHLRALLLAALALLLAGAPAGLTVEAETPALSYLPLISKIIPVADLAVNRVEVIQGITMSDAYTVQVAGRPALLRVFVNVSGADHLDGVTARLTRFVGGVQQDTLTAGPATLTPSTDEGNLGQTLNFNLPAAWLAPNTSYVIELDPANALNESNEANNRFPGGGQQAFNFVNVPTLEVVIVPVKYARPGAPESLPDTSNLNYLTWLPFKVYPVSSIHYTVRSSVLTFNGDLRYSSNGGQGWVDLLNQITSVHSAEDANQTKLYYGLVDSIAVDGCSGGCIAGIAWVNNPPPGFYSKTSLGFAGFVNNRNEASPTFTHEMGHNFGRRHSPCGTTSGLGPYPYGTGAPIGQWGYDPATGLLYSPGGYKDYMSYCGPEWTSDFTYRALADSWGWALAPYGLDAPTSEALVYSGMVDADGLPQVTSAFIETVPAAQLVDEGGQYRLDVLDAQGQVLATQAFTPLGVAEDKQGGAPNMPNLTADYLGFRVAVPVVAGAAGLRVTAGAATLWERTLPDAAPALDATAATSEAANGLTLSVSASGETGVTYRISFSPDGGATWTLLEPAAVTPHVTVPADLLAGAQQPLVQVQASDGLRVSQQTYSVAAP